MKNKKTLVVFYSRTGTTKKLSEIIAKNIGADIDEIIDSKNRKGVMGYILGGRDALLGKLTKIKFNKLAKNYDTILIGTPVWGARPAPAIRTYLVENKAILKKKKIAFFCTMGGTGDQGTFKEMKAVLGKKPVSSLVFKTKEVLEGKFLGLKSFLDQVEKA